MNQENERFVIDTDAKADWAVEKIKEAEAEATRLKNLVQAKREELDEKEFEIDAWLEGETAFLKSCLAEYFETVKPQETKTQKTYKLIAGSLVFKKPSYEYERNEKQLVSWLESSGNDRFVETVKKPKWADFKKHITVDGENVIDTSTGEIVDGVKAVEKPGSFAIK